jgi:glycosyltransferase involved in cell wall biosynthesis
MLSMGHDPLDDRIYWKECLTLKKAGYVVTHIAAGEQDVDYVSAEGIRIITIKRNKHTRINRVVNRAMESVGTRKSFLKKMFGKASSLRSDVYHFHDLLINRIGLKLKALAHQPRVIYDAHESYPDLIRDHATRWQLPLKWIKSAYIERWEMKCARHYNSIITTDDYTDKRFKAAGIPNVQIIRNFSFFSPAAVSAAEKKYDAIYTGTINANRGLFTMLEAASIVQQTIPSFRILIIGEFANSADKSRAQKFIKGLQVEQHVILHEPVAFSEMANFYRQSRIGLIVLKPVKLYRTAVFIKLFEYMAFGLPIIGSNFGTIQNYITKSGAGVCIPSADSKALANAIIMLLKDKVKSKQLGLNGMAAVDREYNWNNESKKLLQLYHDLLSKG